MDTILSFMHLVLQLTEYQSTVEDDGERRHLDIILGALDSVIEYKTAQLSKEVETTDDLKTVIYQLLVPPTVDAIWMPTEEPPLQEDGSSAN